MILRKLNIVNGRLVIYMANEMSFCNIKVIRNREITYLSLNILCKSPNAIHLLMNGILIKWRHVS